MMAGELWMLLLLPAVDLLMLLLCVNLAKIAAAAAARTCACSTRSL
jgi:hypothetical protein